MRTCSCARCGVYFPCLAPASSDAARFARTFERSRLDSQLLGVGGQTWCIGIAAEQAPVSVTYQSTCMHAEEEMIGKLRNHVFHVIRTV